MMEDRLWFRPSEVAETTRIIARCVRCLHSRDLDPATLPDVPLIQTEAKLRCGWRGKDGQQPPCGNRAQIEITITAPGMDGRVELPAPLKPGVLEARRRSMGGPPRAR
ncbi:hypothetical protein [Brevundimonas sp. Root1279]|uniref:hypothetical protein n=1 Tax=Brevundimonas sp. Root1279 TaxID=1736443 RepID=UPI0006F7F58F|nr:hypothetical protein [Brevundimonas sp. Root1279]KQW79693.1 hypothetical protein ASC65_14185 [Brevundimonas sp. Root1279]